MATIYNGAFQLYEVIHTSNGVANFIDSTSFMTTLAYYSFDQTKDNVYIKNFIMNDIGNRTIIKIKKL